MRNSLMIEIGTLYSNKFYRISLPPPENFHRPLWGYNHLPRGERVLRDSLFGDTANATFVLKLQKEARIEDHNLSALLKAHDVNSDIRKIIQERNNAITSAYQLATWYMGLENALFELYLFQLKTLKSTDDLHRY